MNQEMPSAPSSPPQKSSKSSKPTPTQLRAENEDLKKIAKERMIRIRDTEIKIQQAKTILKSEGTPGISMTQDHFRLSQMVDNLRKLFDVAPELDNGE